MFSSSLETLAPENSPNNDLFLKNLNVGTPVTEPTSGKLCNGVSRVGDNAIDVHLVGQCLHVKMQLHHERGSTPHI